MLSEGCLTEVVVAVMSSLQVTVGGAVSPPFLPFLVVPRQLLRWPILGFSGSKSQHALLSVVQGLFSVGVCIYVCADAPQWKSKDGWLLGVSFLPLHVVPRD